MDCERFDRTLPALELRQVDSLSRAAAERHAHQCQRCEKARSLFRQAVDFTALPPLPFPEHLISEVVSGEREIQRAMPTGKRVARALTILAGYAMRPQIAMAALMVLLIGTSLILLRPKPGNHSTIKVTETGLPVLDREAVVVPVAKPNVDPRPSVDDPDQGEPTIAETTAERVNLAPSQVGLPPTPASPSSSVSEVPKDSNPLEVDQRLREEAADRAYSTAMAAFQRGEHEVAKVRFEAISASGGKNAAAAELYGALATEQSSGCETALPRFDAVSASYGQQHIGQTATWHSANCRVALGHNARAAHDFQKLLKARAYRKQATTALGRLARSGKLKK